MNKKEVVEAVTVIETPPMVVVGMVGYIETVKGLRALTTLWAENLNNFFKRRFYKNWYKSKKKSFQKYQANLKENKNFTETLKNKLVKNCTVLRVICHTQPDLLNNKQKKANVYEI